LLLLLEREEHERDVHEQDCPGKKVATDYNRVRSNATVLG
jgi:hypothetical protein